jgi:hypothetical protein
MFTPIYCLHRLVFQLSLLYLILSEDQRFADIKFVKILLPIYVSTYVPTYLQFRSTRQRDWSQAKIAPYAFQTNHPKYAPTNFLRILTERA